jgi:PAS domain S-box-containing protein
MTSSVRPETRLRLAAWHAFFDTLSDAVVVFDPRGRVSFANTQALRVMPCEPGAVPAQLEAALGAPATQWLATALSGRARAAEPPPVRLADGRAATLAWRSLDDGHSVLRIAPAGEPSLVAASLAPVTGAGGPPAHEALQAFWDSPFPATLQDEGFRLVDVNPAYVEFVGHPREALIGQDPVELQPQEDQARSIAARESLREALRRGDAAPLVERRLIDAQGRERWFRAARRSVHDAQGRTLLLAVLQDSTAEHVARERADRSARELDDWFDLSPVGMVLFDDRGLLVRSNPAFEALVGTVPVMLPEASAALQQLLAWSGDAPLPQLQPGAAPIEWQGWLAHPGGSTHALRSIVRCYKAPHGARRFMAVVEDRSIAEERDLAQLQIGALIDTAGVGLATFQESSGWVRPSAGGGGAGHAPTAALQAINREVVLPGSMPEYEKLQHALRHAERAEVRYAIRHPELGERWLLTRVEPATLASGKRTTSVVTLDVTEQERSRERSEQLLREVTTILDSTTAGIAYLRGERLVRCNRRFETMLGLAEGSALGRSVEELFGEHPQARRIAAETLQAMAESTVYETEFDVTAVGPQGEQTLWYSLSVRRAGGDAGPIEVIAVLSDVTRLKSQQQQLEMLSHERELMFNLSEVGLASVREGRIQRANDALAQLTAWPVAELAGLELGSLFVDADEYAARWPQQQNDLRLFGRWSGELQIRRRDGRLLWVQAGLRLVRAGDLSAGFIASFVDVDARHRAEQAVALQAERTRAVLDSVLVGIVTVGAGGIEWMNRSARRMFGGDLPDFLHQPIATVATPEPQHPFRRAPADLARLVEGQAETFECRVRGRDGREFWVVGNVVATGRESTGRQLTYALLDIERRRQAEARMSEAQTSLRRIIEAAPLAITLRDAKTLNILQVNEVAASSVRSSPDKLIGLSPEQVFDPAVAVQRRADMEAALAAGTVTQREYRVVEDGVEHVWDTRYLPLSSRPGEAPDQLLLVATEVTEQRAAQEARLAAAIAQREMLVKEVHHRIKNNLQGVAGLMQQIAQRRPEVAPVIAEVVGQVQAIAQVYGLQVGAAGPLRVRNVVEAIASSVQRTFGRTIRFSVEGTAPHVWALPEAESIPIALTVNELLTNAVKHSAVTTEVACSLVCRDDGVSVVVENQATLPPGFDLGRVPGGVSGLGLVRALLPRRSAKLEIVQRGLAVVATATLQPPSVTLLTPM